MKSFQFVCVFALVAVAACVPVDNKSKNPDAEVVIVPLEGPQDVFDLDDGVVDTGYPGPYFFNPFGNPFSGFMSGMDDMMKRLHDQMSQVLHRLPADNGDWKEITEGKGNTTSTTKVINGHRVTVNETTYGDDGKDSGSFFKIRIVDVRPASEESSDSSEEKVDNRHEVEEVNTKEVEETTPRNNQENSSPELVEENNEIPRGKPEVDQKPKH